MTDRKAEADRATTWLRRIARGWSLIVIGVALLILVGHIVSSDPYAVENYPPVENLMPFSMFLSVLGLALAWRWEGLGGALNVAGFAANLVLFRAIRGEFLPWGVTLTLSLVLVPGILFLVCWWRSKDRGEPDG
jgi:hypothetical protein